MDYINHPCAVADMLVTDVDKTVAYLHDVVEDTDVTLLELSEQFPSVIIEAVAAITKRKAEAYDIYIDRVAQNEIARKVKLADMTHNSDISRISNPSDEDYIRAKKYKEKISQLLNM